MQLKPDQVKEILAIKDNQVTKSLFLTLFGKTEDNLKPKYNPNDWFLLQKGMTSNYTGNTPIKTTVGRYIFNVFLNFSLFGNTMSYFNGTNYMKFDEQVIDAAMENLVPMDKVTEYQTRKTWLEFSIVEILVPGISYDSLKPRPEIQKRKRELFQKYDKEIKAGDPLTAKKIEDELLQLAKELNKDDPSMRLYDLKKPSFGNNYKNIAVMTGGIKNNTTNKYHISENSYLDGIDKHEYADFADQLVTGTYSRSVETAVGGAQVKVFQAALQSETVSNDDTHDCGTTKGIQIELTKENIGMYWYRYIMTKTGLVQLTKRNQDTFINKVVNMRSVLYCKDKVYCEKCCGAMYTKLGITNAGLTASQLSSKIMNLSMKAMHDTSVKTSDIEFGMYFKD